MSDTRPNIVVPADTVVDLYAATSAHPQGEISVGKELSIQMIGNGIAKLYSGASLTGEPTDATGFTPIYQKESAYNSKNDDGAFIWSLYGCTINVSEV